MSYLRYLTGCKGSSGFGSRSTAEDVVTAYSERAKDRVFVITGCSSGIGQEAALQLVKKGAIVVMANRNAEKSAAAARAIRAKTPDAKLYELPLDLNSLESVRNFAKEFEGLKLGKIDVLINNAGVMACPLAYTKDGFETQIGTNHLGHFLLTNLLVEHLKRGTHARVVNLSSTAHSMAYKPEGIRLDDLDAKKKYTEWGAYGQSKLANLLHATELDRKFKEKGYHIQAFSVHPGVIHTELGRHLDNPVVQRFAAAAVAVFGKTIPQGAATTLYCALSPALDSKGGGYYADVNEAKPTHTSFRRNPSLPRQLWEVSARMTQSDMP